MAVEVTSPGDSVNEVEKKIGEYLAAGSKVVWIVDPVRRTITVHRSRTDIAILTEKSTLDGDDVIPGFNCLVAEVFG